jgi:hypothetical protein
MTKYYSSLKNIFFLSFYTFTILLSCNVRVKEKAVTNCSETQRPVGDISICLPTLQGYNECLKNKDVKERAYNESKILDDNIFGIYLPNQLYKEFLQNPNKVLWTEYLKFYSSPKLENQKVPTSFFPQLEEKMNNEFDIVPWKEAIEKVNNDNPNLILDKPILIGHENSYPQTDSYIYLTSYNFIGKSGYILFVANFCIIKERLIYFGYYLTYENENSLNTLKKRNVLFINEFMTLNQ